MTAAEFRKIFSKVCAECGSNCERCSIPRQYAELQRAERVGKVPSTTKQDDATISV